MSEPPSPDGRPARSDAASRLAALLADVVEHPAPAPDDTDETSPAPRRPERAARVADPDRTDDLAKVLTGRRPSSPDAPIVTKVTPTPAPTTDRVVSPPAPPAGSGDATGSPEPGDDRGEPTAEIEALPPAPPAAPTVPIPGPPSAPVAAARPEVDEERSERTEVADGGPPTEATPAAGTAAKAPRRPERPPATRAASPPPASPPRPAWAATQKQAQERAAADEAAAAERARRRAPRLTLRAVAFGIAFALLVAAVPALGWVGKDRLLDSKGGTIVEGNAGSGDPGYLAAVDPTPTALVVLRDAEERPASVAVLAQGAGDAGGTVLLIPLGLQPVDTTWFRTIIDGYDAAQDDDGFRRSIEDVLRVGVPPPIIDLDDSSLATLVAPVAPLTLTVTDPVQLEDGGRSLSGEVELAAEEVGPFLRATREGEPEVAQLERARDLWEAWLAAIGGATTAEPIGAASTGIGDYLRVLSAGDPTVEVLDVQEELVYDQPVLVPGPNMNEQVIAAVPFPQSPREGTRFNVEVVNGAKGEVLPMALLHDLTLAGASLAFIGNADEFGQEETTVAYNGDEWRDAAELVAAMLGPSATVQEMSARRAESETEDLVITIGSDVLAQYEE